jgi:hypothetical protein
VNALMAADENALEIHRGLGSSARSAEAFDASKG